MKKLLFGKSKVKNIKKVNKLSSTNLKVKKKYIISPKSKSFNPSYKVDKFAKMDWKQLKQRFPKLNPTADADFDGLINAKDCKPFDPSKDGAMSRFLGIITGGKKGQTKEEYKAEKASTKLAKQIALREKAKAIVERKAKKISTSNGPISDEQRKRFTKFQEKIERLRGAVKSKTAENIERGIRRVSPTSRGDIASARAKQGRAIVKAVKTFSGVIGTKKKGRQTAEGQKGAGAGRPSQSYKYKDPRTGQPISAIQYHKLMKQIRRKAKAVETQTEVKQRFALAKRGLSPEEVSQAQAQINERMAQLRAMKSIKSGEVPEDYEVAPEEEIIGESEPQVVETRQEDIQRPIQAQRIQQVESMDAVQGSYSVPQGYRIQEDLMTGRKKLVPLPLPEAWTR